MSDVTKFPRRTDDVVRIASRRVREGEPVETVVADLLPKRAWEDLPEVDQRQLFAEGLFSTIQVQMVSFLEAHQEAFLDHVKESDPAAYRAAKATLDQTNIAGAFSAFVDLELRP